MRARGERVPNVLRCQLSRSVSLKSPSLPCVSIKSEKLTFPGRRRRLVAQIYLMMYHDGWDYWPSGEQATAPVFLITARAFHKIYNILNGRAQVFNSQDSWADYGIERRLCAGQINYRCSSGAVKIRFCGWTAYNSYSAYASMHRENDSFWFSASQNLTVFYIYINFQHQFQPQLAKFNLIFDEKEVEEMLHFTPHESWTFKIIKKLSFCVNL